MGTEYARICTHAEKKQDNLFTLRGLAVLPWDLMVRQSWHYVHKCCWSKKRLFLFDRLKDQERDRERVKGKKE